MHVLLPVCWISSSCRCGDSDTLRLNRAMWEGRGWEAGTRRSSLPLSLSFSPTTKNWCIENMDISVLRTKH